VAQQNQKSEAVTLRLNSYSISFEPIDNMVSDELRKKLDESRISVNLLEQRPDLLIKPLEELYEQYPHEPSLLNNLAFAYQGIGDSRTAITLFKKLKTSFPDYLFAKISKALTELSYNRYEEIPAIFNNCFDLKDLYPERDIFHVGEVMAFFHVMGIYFCRIGDARTARVYYNGMKRLAEKNDRRPMDVMKEILAVENKTKR